MNRARSFEGELSVRQHATAATIRVVPRDQLSLESLLLACELNADVLLPKRNQLRAPLVGKARSSREAKNGTCKKNRGGVTDEKSTKNGH
jgi:hypothetical protein